MTNELFNSKLQEKTGPNRFSNELNSSLAVNGFDWIFSNS